MKNSTHTQKPSGVSEKRCGLYLRVSTDLQAQVRDGSLDTQESRLRSYVQSRSSGAQKWQAEQVYREEGKTGKNTRRPELQQMVADVMAGKIDAVLCTKLDRVTRSLLDFYGLHTVFKENGAEFITLDENFDTSTPTGKAMLNISLVFAELEREQTSARTKEKMQWRAEQGLWNGGQILGYDLIDGRLMPNQDEAELVKLMFKKYLELGSVHQVKKYLNDNGYRMKKYTSRRGNERGGNKFYHATVNNLLQNPVYIGKIQYKEDIFDGQHEAIVTEDLFSLVQHNLKTHAQRRTNFMKKTKHVFILLGLVKCGFCGSYMTSKYCKGSRGLRFYYQCTKNSHHGKTECNMKYVPAEQLESIIVEKIKQMSVDKELLNEIVDKANSSSGENIKVLEQERRPLENKLQPISQQLDNYAKAIGEGFGINKTVLNKMQDLEKSKEQLKSHIAELSNHIIKLNKQKLDAETMEESLVRFSQIVEVATPEEKKSLIPRIIDSIIYKPGEIKIALFDRPVERGLCKIGDAVNPNGDYAFSGIDWLPE